MGSTGGRYIIAGWSRITTGTNHILNTDWAEKREYTDLNPIISFSHTTTGDGVSKIITIPHNLGATPVTVNVTPTSQAAAGVFFVTKDSVNIIVNYSTPPILNGTLSYDTVVKK
jgi:hypothetical protein